MDLNENREQNLENLNDGKINKNINNFFSVGEADPEKFISEEKDAKNKIKNINLQSKIDNILTYSVCDKQKYVQFIHFIEEILDDNHFIKPYDVKTEEERILLLYHKPKFTLLDYLEIKKEDIRSRFLLFKQSLEIVLSLISLGEKFLFFNFSIFFVEDKTHTDSLIYKDNKNCENSENFLELKIFYHIDVQNYRRELESQSRNAYYWIYYLIAIIFKHFYHFENSDNVFSIKFYLGNDQNINSCFSKIFQFATDKFMKYDYLKGLPELITLVNGTLEYLSISPIIMNKKLKDLFFSEKNMNLPINNFPLFNNQMINKEYPFINHQQTFNFDSQKFYGQQNKESLFDSKLINLTNNRYENKESPEILDLNEKNYYDFNLSNKYKNNFLNGSMQFNNKNSESKTFSSCFTNKQNVFTHPIEDMILALESDPKTSNEQIDGIYNFLNNSIFPQNRLQEGNNLNSGGFKNLKNFPKFNGNFNNFSNSISNLTKLSYPPILPVSYWNTNTDFHEADKNCNTIPNFFNKDANYISFNMDDGKLYNLNNVLKFSSIQPSININGNYYNININADGKINPDGIFLKDDFLKNNINMKINNCHQDMKNIEEKNYENFCFNNKGVDVNNFCNFEKKIDEKVNEFEKKNNLCFKNPNLFNPIMNNYLNNCSNSIGNFSNLINNNTVNDDKKSFLGIKRKNSFNSSPNINRIHEFPNLNSPNISEAGGKIFNNLIPDRNFMNLSNGLNVKESEINTNVKINQELTNNPNNSNFINNNLNNYGIKNLKDSNSIFTLDKLKNNQIQNEEVIKPEKIYDEGMQNSIYNYELIPINQNKNIPNLNYKDIDSIYEIQSNIEKNLNTGIGTLNSFKEINFEIKKISNKFSSNESNFVNKNNIKNCSKSSSNTNIFNIQSIPKNLKNIKNSDKDYKNNYLLNSIMMFNDKTLKKNNSKISENVDNSNIMENSNSLNDSSKSLIAANKCNSEKDLPFQIKNIKKPYDNNSGSYEKSFSEKDENDNQNNEEYSEILKCVFSDIQPNNKCGSLESVKRSFDKNFKFNFIPENNISSEKEIIFNKKKNQKKLIEKNSKTKEHNKFISNKINMAIVSNIVDNSNGNSIENKSTLNENGNIFSITKKICMNNIRSRLKDKINFKRRKLSVEKLRKQNIKNFQNKAVVENLNEIENAMIHSDERCLIFNKNIINLFLKNYYFGRTDINTFNSEKDDSIEARKKKSSSKIKNKKFGIKINDKIFNQNFHEVGTYEDHHKINRSKSLKRKEIKSTCAKKNGFLKRKRNRTQDNKKTPISKQKNKSNSFFKSDINLNSSKKIKHSNNLLTNVSKSYNNKISRRLFSNSDSNIKKIINSKTIPNLNSYRRLSKNNKTNKFESINTGQKISEKKDMKKKPKNICKHAENEKLQSIKSNENVLEGSNQKKKKERYDPYQKEFIEDKINSVKLEIQKYTEEYPKDLEEEMKDKMHRFMKQNFPIMYEIENFYLFIKMKKDKKNELLEYIANSEKFPQLNSKQKIEEYVEDIRLKLNNFKKINIVNEIQQISGHINTKIIDDEIKKIIEIKSINKEEIKEIKENKVEEKEDICDVITQKNVNEIKEEIIKLKILNKIDGSLESNLNVAISQIELNEKSNLHNSQNNDIETNGYNEISYGINEFNEIKKENDQKNLPCIDKFIEKNDFREILKIEEDDIIKKSEDTNKKFEKRKNKHFLLENPLSGNKIWSPNVLNNEQVFDFFEKAGKIWPKDFNWSEEIALILLNKFDYSIENTLLILNEPTEEIIQYMKDNLTNKSSLNAACKSRSKRSNCKRK